MKFEKKYTMEEFKEMFEKAEKEVLRREEEQFEEATKDKAVDPMARFAFTMQNMMVIGELKIVLFKEDKDNE